MPDEADQTPNPGTKAALEADNARLTEENDRLRAQLAAAGRPGGVAAPQHTFVLSEGARQELEAQGWATIDGQVMTTEEVRAKLTGNQAGSKGVKIADPPDVVGLPQPPPKRPGIRGFDYVYPSVEPGKIDPAVAGTPGINGPAADTKTAVETDQVEK